MIKDLTADYTKAAGKLFSTVGEHGSVDKYKSAMEMGMMEVAILNTVTVSTHRNDL